jgi:hypothetical protein
LLLSLCACGRYGFSDTSGTSGTSSDASSTGDGSSDPDATILPSTWAAAPAQPPTTADLWAVYAFSTNDIWIAGTTGAVQHYTGTWSPTTSGVTSTLFMFWGSPNDLWLVGRSCDVVRWMASSWAPATIPGCAGNQDFLSLNGSATTNMWATGTGGNIQQLTTSWLDRSYGNDDYWDTYIVSANDVVIVGTQGAILHWNGNMMVPEPSNVTVTLAAIASGAPGDYWVVGGNGTILHKTGTGGWTQVASPTTTFLYDVVAVSATDLWAVGSGGVILHGDGTTWLQVASPTTNTLRNIDIVPSDGLVAVGTGGTVLLHPP